MFSPKNLGSLTECILNLAFKLLDVGREGFNHLGHVAWIFNQTFENISVAEDSLEQATDRPTPRMLILGMWWGRRPRAHRPIYSHYAAHKAP